MPACEERWLLFFYGDLLEGKIRSDFLFVREEAGAERGEGHEKLPDAPEGLQEVDACGRVSFDSHAEAKVAGREVDGRGFDIHNIEC